MADTGVVDTHSMVGAVLRAPRRKAIFTSVTGRADAFSVSAFSVARTILRARLESTGLTRPAFITDTNALVGSAFATTMLTSGRAVRLRTVSSCPTSVALADSSITVTVSAALMLTLRCLLAVVAVPAPVYFAGRGTVSKIVRALTLASVRPDTSSVVTTRVGIVTNREVAASTRPSSLASAVA